MWKRACREEQVIVPKCTHMQVFQDFAHWHSGHPATRIQQDAASVLQSLADRGAQASFVLSLGASAPAASALAADTQLCQALNVRAVALACPWAPVTTSSESKVPVQTFLGTADASGSRFQADAAAGEAAAAMPWLLTQPERYEGGDALRDAELTALCQFFDSHRG